MSDLDVKTHSRHDTHSNPVIFCITASRLRKEKAALAAIVSTLRLCLGKLIPAAF